MIGAAAQLNQVAFGFGKKGHNGRSIPGEKGDFGAGEIVLGQEADFFKQPGAEGVIKVLAGEALG